MARIRTIKPEFWSSPGIEALDPYARLLFIAMWNWADDTGRGTCEVREIAGFAFPRDENQGLVETRRHLGEIRRVFGVVFYTVAGRHYYEIPSWDRHQKIDKRSGAKHPASGDGTPWNPDPDNCPDLPGQPNSAETREDPPSPRRDLGAGTGEQGNRGTGEVVVKDSSPSAQPLPVKPEPGFDEFWSAYPRKESKPDAIKAFAKAIKIADAEEIIAGAARFRADPNREQQFTPHAPKWLNRQGWTEPPLPGRRPPPGAASPASTTDAKVAGTLALAAQLRAAEQATERREISA